MRTALPGRLRPGRLRPGRLRLWAVCGLAGPALFTLAWVVSSLRQTGHAATSVQLSGLAAVDARDPQIMIAGFVGLGACSVAFGAALGRLNAAGSAGPWLVTCAGAATVVAGVFWTDQEHDVASGLAYAMMIAAPPVLAWRFHREPDWAALSSPLQVLTLISAASLALFASRSAAPWNGTVQRLAVTLALGAEALTAWRMLALQPLQAGRPGNHR